VNLQQLETEARKYPGSHHVRDNNRDDRRGAKLAVRGG
jgi:hypothetical protein